MTRPATLVVILYVTSSPLAGDPPPRATYVRSADEVLADVALVASEPADLADLLNRLADLTMEATGADRVSLFLLDADRACLRLWSVTGRHPSAQLWDRAVAMPAIPLAEFPMLAQLLANDAPVAIPDARSSILVPPAWAEAFQLQSLVAAPLLRGADALGVLVVDYRTPHTLDEPLLRLIRSIASSCALATAHALVSSALKDRNENLQSLLDVSRSLSLPVSLDDVASQVADSVVRVLKADALSVHLLDERRTRYRTVTQRNTRMPGDGRVADLPRRALRAVLDAWRADGLPEPVVLPRGPETLTHPWTSTVVLPLCRPAAEVFGFIIVVLPTDAPSPTTLELAGALASHVAFAIDRVRLDEQMALGAEYARSVLALYEFDADDPEGLLAGLRQAVPPTLGFQVHGLRLAAELGDVRVNSRTTDCERQIWKAWRRRKTRPAVHQVGTDIYAPVWRDSRVVGMVLATALRPGLAHHERELLEGLASALGHAVERIRMRAAVRSRERELALAEERAHVASSLQATIGRFLEAIQVCGEDLAAGFEGRLVGQRASSIVSLARTARGELDQTNRSLPALTYDRGGLEATLNEVVGELGGHLDAAAAFEVRGERRALSVEVEQSLIRMVHETLSRVERNSRAGAIAVRLEFRPHEVELVIRDDGTDLATREQGQGGLGAHFGLRLVQRRLEALGGELFIERPSPRGLELRARVPA